MDITRLALSDASPLPLHYQLQHSLRTAIEKGDLKPGEMLPSELELTTVLGVSRTTVRQALGALAQEGLIVRIQGKGTQVAGDGRSARAPIVPILLDALAAGLEPADEPATVKRVRSSSDVARRLRIRTGASVVHVSMRWDEHGDPGLVSETYLPLEVARRFSDDELRTRPVWPMLQERGVHVEEVDYRLEAVLPNSDVARILQLTARAPVLKLERRVIGGDGAVVGCEDLYYRGDRMRTPMTIPIAPRVAIRPRRSAWEDVMANWP